MLKPQHGTNDHWYCRYFSGSVVFFKKRIQRRKSLVESFSGYLTSIVLHEKHQPTHVYKIYTAFLILAYVQ